MSFPPAHMPFKSTFRWSLGTLVVLGSALACDSGDPEPDLTSLDFQSVALVPSAGLLSVHGTTAKDIWIAGADDGKGPVVLHYDGSVWQRQETGFHGDLWWVHAFAEDEALFVGSDSNILRFDGEKFTRDQTPGLGKHTIFGLWGAKSDDVYAVGAVGGRNGFIWHHNGTEWSEVALPEEMPQNDKHDVPAFFKVAGCSSNEVWIVGDNGVVLRGSADEGFNIVESGTTERLFTVDCADNRVLVVGGDSQAVVLEGATGGDLQLQSLPGALLLQGATFGSAKDAWLTGKGPSVYRETASEIAEIDLEFEGVLESLHAVWVDPDGGTWTVGGAVLSGKLDGGVAFSTSPSVPLYEAVPVVPPAPVCPEANIDPAPDASMARRWNEQLLGAVRRDMPRPTVHARNLYHVSLALWDAWAAFDADAQGILVKEKLTLDEQARDEAMAYASYRILSHRYVAAVGGPVSQACFDAFLDKLDLDPGNETTTGDSGAALGNRIGQAVIEHFADDGANEQNNYADPEGFRPAGPPLLVDEPGTTTKEPLVWQELLIAEAETQNGIPEGTGLRDPVGLHWREVTPFALERANTKEPYIDVGAPASEWSEELVSEIMDAVVRSSHLDPTDLTEIDISPAKMGNNALGTNDGKGYSINPITGEVYKAHKVLRGDFTRVLAEFWADGPASETPPGHWNVVANDVADAPGFSRKLFGTGPAMDALAWDVHVYLALNGALHDAAIAAWELKRVYDAARPITLVRYYGTLGQSSDPDGPSFHVHGLPLVDDLTEIITEQTSASGERHAHLQRYIGEMAVRSWRGEPGDREHEVGGVGWIRIQDWIPYQRRTFVTPAFPGYVSGHSTFSRAAAEVLAGMTGSDYFPGGLFKQQLPAGYLVFEAGPAEPIELQWATYFDAADQAGQSRIWGGIHIAVDDFDGRRVGAMVGESALQEAKNYFVK